MGLSTLITHTCTFAGPGIMWEFQTVCTLAVFINEEVDAVELITELYVRGKFGN